MKALITGAEGFCGTHLSGMLQAKGVEVIGVSAVADAKGVVHLASVHDEERMTGILRETRPDFVFHLAGTSRATRSWEIYEVNIGFARSLLDAITRAGLRGVPTFLAGSCAEYGMVSASELPVSEETACRPTTDYAISKLAQTHLGLAAAREGHRIVAARTSNLVGPGMPDSLFLGSVVRQIAQIAKGNRSPVLEVGNLETSRDFIDVQDAVRCYWKLVNQPAAFGSIVNVCSGSAVPIQRLLDLAIAAAGASIDVIARADRMKRDDLKVFFASNTRLASLVGEAPTFSPEKSVAAMLASELT